MKAIVNTAPGEVKWQDVAVPAPGPRQVRVRTGACAICATDMEMIRGWNRTGFPSIPGHEWSGTVEAVGPGVDPTLIGRRCVAENVLQDGGEVGFEHPGGYGACLVTEAERLYLLPAGFPLDRAALIEPLAVCVRGMNRLRSDATGPALVFGDGPIGLLMVALLARKGLRPIVAVGGRDSRLELAKAFGAVQTINYHQTGGASLVEAISAQGITGYMSVVEASGAPQAMEAALVLAARTGRILVVGDYAEKHASFAWNHLLHRELELIGTNASEGAWEEAVRLVVEDRVPIDYLITHRLPAERFEEGFALMRARSEEVIKVVLEWPRA